MLEWYRFSPVDTLFFKGSQPMVLGEHHVASHIFPPPAHTLCGALRTAVLVQNSVSMQDYYGGGAPAEIYDAIGKAGDPPPFSVTGPLFMFEDDIYIPAPYLWFREKDSGDGKVRIFKGVFVKSRLLKSELSEFIWAKGNNGDLVSIGGMWIKGEALYSADDSIEIRECNAFFENEPRTGIALEKNRKVRKGHLYSFNHVRLKKNVRLVFATDSNLPLEAKGPLKIGAEQRFGWYEKISNDSMGFKDEGDLYLSLSTLEGTPETNDVVVATGKIHYFGGWDLHVGFHKPMKGYFPAGTVLNKKINNNIIGIGG